MAVTFTPFPDNRRNPLNPSQADYEEQIRRTKAALAANLIRDNPFDFIVLANGYQYEKEYNLGPAWKKSDGNAKTWWAGYGFEAVMPARNVDDSWAVDQNTDSVEGLQWTTRELQDFYKTYRSHFPVVPRFVLRQFSADEAGRAQFGDGPAMDFPVAKITRNDPTANFRSSFPPGIGFRVNDAGVLEWFKLAEYRAEYPLTVTATIPSVNRPPAAMVLMAVSMTMSNPGLTAEQKVEAIRRVVA